MVFARPRTAFLPADYGGSQVTNFKTVLRKTAQVTAAGILPATALAVTTQTEAQAAVVYNCGRNFSPGKATYAHTVETGYDKSIASYVSLREGTIDGVTDIYWARERNTFSGWVDLNWYSYPNNTTHWDCREYTGYSDGGYYNSRNYTQGVLYGWNTPTDAFAYDFWPCMRWSSPGGTPGAIACGAWYSP
jgi:hypothetical protein